MLYALIWAVKLEIHLASSSQCRKLHRAETIHSFSSSSKALRHTLRGKMAHYPAPPSRDWTELVDTLIHCCPVLTIQMTRQTSNWRRFTQKSVGHSRQPCISCGPRTSQALFRSRSARKVGNLPRPVPEIQDIQHFKAGPNQYGT